MDKTIKKTRLKFLFEKFKVDYKKAIDNNILLRKSAEPFSMKPDLGEDDKLNRFYDSNFVGFAITFSPDSLKYEKQHEKLFYFLVDCDPSENKEYLNWLLNLTSQQFKDRVSIRDGYTDYIFTISEIQNFYEDLITKGKEALETFSFLKKTNALDINNRDINRYKTLSAFLDVVKPYLIKDIGDDSVHTLDHKEIKCIQNFIENGKNPTNGVGSAELVYENEKWVIVITHDKEANVEFGKYTTWCTAGNRYGSMFDSYHGRGELFVLIHKGYGSKKSIKQHPEYRLQFHFEDDQFMDANDKRININKFLHNEKGIKDYFKSYIVKTALPKRRQQKNVVRQMDEIKYLLDLGFGDEIIKILKETKPESMDFSGHSIDNEYLSGIGEVTSLKRLDLSECTLSELPESIKNLKNLQHLKFRNNPLITVIPDWVSELTNLETLDCAGCDLLEIGDISGNINLREVVIDFNRSLKSLPKNIGKLTKLVRLSAAACDIRSIDDDLFNTPLFLLDINNNSNLTKIPIKLSKIPTIQGIIVDGTAIPDSVINELIENSNGNVCILKYA